MQLARSTFWELLFVRGFMPFVSQQVSLVRVSYCWATLFETGPVCLELDDKMSLRL